MKRKFVFILSLAIAGCLASCGNGGGSVSQNGGSCTNEPVMERMLCEYVPDGQTAVIYGSNLKNCEIMFPGADFPAKVLESSNDKISYA